jgi:UDP-N-acetylglucosamine--N-acetylmuramyl-(pentapeptide) pyrophosphoryl-undecaprenol N-acetylglucosamine transferase
MKRRIAYFVHGRGQGHASRALSVVPALRQGGHEVALYAAGDALPMLAPLGPITERPLVLPGRAAYVELARRAVAEPVVLRFHDIDLVVSDGDQGALLGASAAGIPSLAIGHDLVFTRGVLPGGLSRRHLLHQRLNALVPTYLSTRRVAVHFLPCTTRDVNTLVARPDVDAAPVDGARTDRLVCYFRDAGSEPLVDAARRHWPELSVLGGRGAGRTVTSREEFRRLLSTSRAVMGSAGSNLLAECVLYGTPLLAFYRENDAEQALNAHLLEAAGAGMACAFEAATPAVSARFRARVEAGDFRRVNLRAELPSVVDAVLAQVRALSSR